MNQFNRAEIIDNNFLESLKSNSFPKNEQSTAINDLKINTNEIVSIFESQVFSRHIDIKARELKDKGQCFYTIGSSGHESNAVFGNVFPFSDIAFLHYRSGP
ncbi:MFS transporter, partial [bacterium]|nr:MFS transporter [bacterium]